MGLVNGYGRELPSGLVDNKVSFVKLLGYFSMLLLKGHHVFEVNWKPASIVLIVVCEKVWDQSRKRFRVECEVSFSEGVDQCVYDVPYPTPDARTGTVDSQSSAGHAILQRSVLICPQNSGLHMLLSSIYRGCML